MLSRFFQNETEVQFYYSKIICEKLKCRFSARFRTDGIYESENLKILSEFKYNLDLSQVSNQVRCIAQILGYLSLLEKAAEKMPNLILIGSDKKFVLFETNRIEDFRSIKLDSSPSSLFQKPPQQLVENFNIQLSAINISYLNQIKELIESLDLSTTPKLRVSLNNVERLFEEFYMSKAVISKLDNHEYVALFVSLLFGEFNRVEGKPDLIVTPLTDKKIIRIDRRKFDLFISTIQKVTTISAKDDIIEKLDSLIEDVTRRFLGEFYTPKVWVDEAHKLLESVLGSSWKEEFVVWDPCCGTGNLTRDYWFKELYCSTLNQSDIDIMNQRHYNPEAVKFQYDFLNDDISKDSLKTFENKLERKAPELVESLSSQKPIVFLMNPPFVEHGNYSNPRETKVGVAETRLKTFTRINQAASRQLLCQFLYRILILKETYQLDDVVIATFSNITSLLSNYFKRWRDQFFSQMSFVDNFTFKATEFGLSDWPVLFTIFRSKPGNRTRFCLKLKERTKERERVVDRGVITIYNTDDQLSLKKWLEEATPKQPLSKTMPLLNNGLNVIGEVKAPDSFLFYFLNKSNNIGSAIKHVGFFSSKFNDSGVFVYPQNFKRAIIAFSARRLLTLRSNWITSYLELLAPEEGPELDSFYNDCLVFCLFEDQNKVCSFSYKNIPIRNELFWISKERMLSACEKCDFELMYRYIETDPFEERFMFSSLQSIKLGSKAEEVLKVGTELVLSSIERRKELSLTKTNLFLERWDASWFQLKDIVNTDSFSKLYKDFKNELLEKALSLNFVKGV